MGGARVWIGFVSMSRPSLGHCGGRGDLNSVAEGRFDIGGYTGGAGRPGVVSVTPRPALRRSGQNTA